MNWYSIFYLITVADNAITFFGWLAGLSTAYTIIYWIVRGVSADDGFWRYDEHALARKRLFRLSYTILIAMFIGWAGVVFTPSKKDCLLIVAGGSVANFLTSDSSAKALPADVAKFLHLSLRKEVEDLSAEAKAELGLNTPKDDFINKAKEMTKEQLIEFLKKDTTILK